MDSLDATTMRAPTRERAGDSEATSLALTIGWHADPTRIGEVATFEKSVKLSRLEPEFGAGRNGAGQPLADPNLSRQPIELIATGSGEVELHAPDGGSSVEVDGVPLSKMRVITGSELDRGVVIDLAERVVLVLRRSRGNRGGGERHGLVGASAEIGWLCEQIERVASTDVNVLLRGPTGSGKELVAEAIHRESQRNARAFIAVNMTTLPPSTAVSQLFGHRRGAFTGAEANHGGFFAAATGGTLFLDEVGETPLEVQAMLLRTLETGELYPVGSTTATSVDVRIVAATDADLERAVDEETFRSPLLHRLAGYQIELPGLNARREDVGLLLAFFLKQELAKLSATALEVRAPTEPLWISTKQMTRLITHSWPGNVRQLRNLARRLAIGSGDVELVTDDELKRGLVTGALVAEQPVHTSTDAAAAPPSRQPKPLGSKRKPEEISDDELIESLRSSRWKTGAAAATLGISRTSLYAMIERCDRVRKARDIDADEINAAIASADGAIADAALALEVSERGLKLRMKELGLTG